MASGTRMVAIFVGTTTASEPESMTAVLTWDLSGSPSGSTPTATSSEGHISELRSAFVQTGTPSGASSPPDSTNTLARTTDVSQQFSPTYDEPKSMEPSSGLRTSLIVLSAVLFVTAIVIGWLVWRRRLGQRDRLNHNLSRPSPLLQQSTSAQLGARDMKFPTPSPEKDWRLKIPAHPIDPHCQQRRNEKSAALVKLGLSEAMSSKDPCILEHPPAPPMKQKSKLPFGTTPASSTATPGCSSSSRGAAAHAAAHATIALPPPLKIEMNSRTLFE